MSETSILPGSVPAPADSDHDAPPPVVEGEETEGNGANRRILLIAGAIAGVIILAAAAYLLLHKSSPSTPALVAPPTGTSAAPATGGTVTKTKVVAPAPAHLPRVVTHPAVRDPFKPLVVVPPAVTKVPAPTQTVPASTQQTTGTSPTGTTVPVTTQTSPPPINGIGSPQSIRLIKTTSSTATFDVGYPHNVFRRFQVSTPAVFSDTGTIFDKIFSLISVEDHSVTLQIGDATPFDLQTGVVHVV